MLCCASKKALSAVADPIEYASEPEIIKKEPEVDDDAKPDAADTTAATGSAHAMALTVEAPLSPEKKTVPKLEEPTPLQSISISLGSLFEKVAESARGLIEAAAPAAAPATVEPVAGAPAAASFETSSTGSEEVTEAATESTAPAFAAPASAAPASAAPAPAPAAAAPAAEVLQSL
jgi:hypothetical protein